MALSDQARDEAALADISVAAHRIIEFTANLDEGAFADDPRTQFAVLYLFLVVGEAVKRLSRPFRARHPNIAWREAAAMRDVLIHDYDDVNLHRVWNAATEDIPKLLYAVESLLDGTEPL
jgi:uncharacterized protein with HEPN domain